jgi:hypothetical protein
MKLTSKQRRFAVAMIQALSGAACTSCGSTSDAGVDVWISDGTRPSRLHGAPSDVVCVHGDAAHPGWQSRMLGDADARVRSVDVVIPHPAASGTARFYLGLTIANPAAIDQVTIETRSDAARRSGEGRAWVDTTATRVRMTIVARVADSIWYVVDVRCRASVF